MTKFTLGDNVKVFYPGDRLWYNVEAKVVDLSDQYVLLKLPGLDYTLQIPRKGAENILQKVKPKEPKKTFEEAASLVAEMFNELKWEGRKDWTGKEIFEKSPAGEVFHVLEYYRIAKDYFEMDEEDRKKLTGIPVAKNGRISFTVPSTWKSYKLSDKEMREIIKYAEGHRGKPSSPGNFHSIVVNGNIVTHSQLELMALLDYLKGDMRNADEETTKEEKKKNYIEVSECPNPYVGLEWTEMYSYYGRVVADTKRSMAFDWQENNREWRQALEETYYVIEDTVEKAPYILTADQFKQKFSYNQDGKKCWVRFKL